MRSHHHIEWGDELPARTIVSAFAIGLSFYGVALLLTWAERFEAITVIGGARAAQASIAPATDRPSWLLPPDQNAVDSRASVDHWSCRLGC